MGFDGTFVADAVEAKLRVADLDRVGVVQLTHRRLHVVDAEGAAVRGDPDLLAAVFAAHEEARVAAGKGIEREDRAKGDLVRLQLRQADKGRVGRGARAEDLQLSFETVLFSAVLEKEECDESEEREGDEGFQRLHPCRSRFRWRRWWYRLGLH